MGIKGLFKILEQELDNSVFPEESIPAGSQLLIDGDGFLFHVVHGLAKRHSTKSANNGVGISSIMDIEYGGNYYNYDQIVRLEIEKLRNQLQLEIVIFFDGPNTFFKYETAAKRREQIDEQWMNFFKAVYGDKNVKLEDLPLPPLCKEQLVYTLQQIVPPIEIVYCKQEADQEIAVTCALNNSKGIISYCYAADSDFIAMKDCPYIHFNSLVSPDSGNDSNASSNKIADNDKKAKNGKNGKEEEKKGKKEKEEKGAGNSQTEGNEKNGEIKNSDNNRIIIPAVTARVWRRNCVAELLGLTETQFVDLCILMGNDFTGNFPKDLYDRILESHEIPVKYGTIKFKETLQQVLQRNGSINSDADGSDSWVLKSSLSPAVELSIQYSRAFYQLEDITVFLTEENQKIVDNFYKNLRVGATETVDVVVSRKLLEEEAEYENMKLSEDQKELVVDWIKRNGKVIKDSKEKKSHNVNAGKLAVLFLQDLRKEKKKRVSNKLATKSNVDFQEVTTHQIDGLHQMLQFLKVRRGKVPSKDKVTITWTNVYLCNLYQIIAREIIRNLPKYAKGEVLPPYLFFDGRSFHSIMQTMSDIAFNEEILKAVDLGSTRNETTTDKKSDAINAVNTKLNQTRKVSQQQLEGNLSRSTQKFQSQTEQEDKRSNQSAENQKILRNSSEENRDVLPIDAHRDTILNKINSDRVVIIHGETGCGKSTRLPCMLLSQAESSRQKCKMMVSQPRRIAAASLMKRLRESLGKKVGMRMGHGVRDDHADTKITFVTTGYLVRLLAHCPHNFSSHTHLIIDEVHERSVDGDVLCFLARRLLTIHPTIRIVLMSATVHVELYKQYFSYDEVYYGDLDCLSVGVRRFPLDIQFVDDIAASKTGRYPKKLLTCCQSIIDVCERCRGSSDDAIPAKFIKDQYLLAEVLVKTECELGTAVLIFVSGISDITELYTRFESVAHYKIVGIHSDIPFEEQEDAFTPTESNELKIIIATNAAESSITLPFVDTVICLGTHKAIQFNTRSDRVQLSNTWISKASATQRAGRTGRVRPGKVFRLYSKELYERFDEHEKAEIHRQPLHDTILNLRLMLEDSEGFEGVVPVMNQLLEPPAMKAVDYSFQHLFDCHMTTQPDDSGKLTTIGRFAAQLPLDLSLARLVIMGITLGVAREAVVLAGALSQPKSVFRLASPLIHKDPNEYNEIVKSTFLSMVKIDNGMYSEPLMMLRLFLMWRNMKVDERQSKLTKLGIAHVRMRQFSSCCINLLERVNHTNRMNLSYDGMSEESLDHQLTKLRLILLWTSDSNLIRMKPSIKMDENLVIKVSSPTLTDNHLRLMFPSEIKYTCQKLGKRIFDAALSKRRLETSREVWLRELLQMSYAGGVRICWIVDNGKQLKVEDEKSDDKIHTNDSHVSSVDEAIRVSPSHILFAVCCSDPTKSETSLEQAHYSYEKAVLSLKSTFGASKLQFLSQCSFISGGKEMFFHVFIIEHPSKKMIKSVKDLHDLYDYSVSLSIVNAVSAHLTAANISLNQDQLANFFFKLDELDDGCNQWHMDEQTENRKIAEQVLHSQQIISFEEPDATETSGNISIRDIPLGLRLYKAYCAGYRDRHMRLRNESHQSNTKKIVPGSAAWQAAKSDRIDVKEAVDNDDIDDIVSVEAKTVTSKWSFIGVEDMNGFCLKSTPAILPSNSILCTTVHTGKEYVYGIAQSVMEFGKDGICYSLLCQGITLLPIGKKWITLALKCNGKSVSSKAATEDNHDDTKITEMEIDICELIFDHLAELRWNEVKENEQLCHLVKLLFEK